MFQKETLEKQIKIIEIALKMIKNQAQLNQPLDLKILKYQFKNIKDSDGNSPLHLLLKENDLPSLEFLLKNHIDINLTNKLSMTILHQSIIDNNAQAFKLIMDYHPKLETKDSKGRTAFYLAIINNNEIFAKALLKAGAKANARDINGLSAIFKTVESQNIKMTQFLLENGANPNVRSDLRKTPLHFAAANHDTEMINLLLKYQANVNARDQVITNPSTPLDIASNDYTSFALDKNQESAKEILVNAGGKHAKPYYQNNFKLGLFYEFGQPFKDRINKSDKPINVHYVGTRLTYYIQPDLSLFWSYSYGFSPDSDFKDYHIVRIPGTLSALQEITSGFGMSFFQELHGSARGFTIALLALSSLLPEGISWNVYLPTSQWLSFSLDLDWASANAIIPKSSAIAANYPSNVEINGFIGGRMNILLGENFNIDLGLNIGFSYTSIEFVWGAQFGLSWLF